MNPFNHDINDDNCKAHGTPLYAGCPKCHEEMVEQAQEMRECLIAMLSNFGGITCAKTHPYDWDRWRKAAFQELSNNSHQRPAESGTLDGVVRKGEL